MKRLAPVFFAAAIGVFSGCASLEAVFDRIPDPPAQPDVPDVPDAPQDPAPPSDPVAGVDLSRAEWWGKSSELAAAWPVSGDLRVSGIGGSTFDINQATPLSGSGQVIAYFVRRDGRWVGGGFDGCGNDPFTFKRKTWGNAKTGIPGSHKGGDEQKNRDYVKLRDGDAVVLCLLSTGSRTRTPASQCFLWPSGKEVDPASISDPAPPAPDPLPGAFSPPPRTGSPAYAGKGDIAKWLEVPGGNPSKSVELSCWVKFNGWPRKDVGAHLINKGLVGSSWAYGLCVRPDEVVYSATKGAVAASFKFKTGTWYHVRVLAGKSTASFWVDGQPVPVSRKETDALFSSNDQPVRIGGHTMGWSPPSAWFNGSLDGEMSDWVVEVR